MDYENSPNVIFSFIKMEKVKFEDIKELFVNTSLVEIPRLKSKIVNLLNEYYWVQVSDEEAAKNIQNVNLLKNDKDVYDFFEVEFCKNFSHDKPMWEAYVQEDFGN